MARILGVFLVKALRTGGNRRYLELMEALAARGNSVFVIMNSLLDYAPHSFTKIGIKVPYTPYGFPPGSFLFKRGVKRHLSAIKQSAPFDVIHIHGDMHLKAALFLRKALHTPLFYACRNNDVERDRVIRPTLKGKALIRALLLEQINLSRERQIARFAEIITFQSTGDMGSFIKRTRCDEKKIVIIPGNIGLPRFLPEWERTNNSVKVERLVYVGSPAANKGLPELLKALGVLKTRGYGFVRCSILARINGDETARLVKALDIEEMLVFEGYQSPFPHLAAGDLMVYPVLYDAFPDAVLEALHTGCPVIASAAGGLPDMLHYPDLLFEAGNITEIADRIERCIIDTAFYENIRTLCAARAAVYHFDWAEQFEKAMREKGANECLLTLGGSGRPPSRG